MSRNENFSVFKRLFIISSLLLFAIYAIVVSLFLNSINYTSEELLDRKKTQAEVLLKNMEQQLTSIYNHEVNLANSTNATKLAYMIYNNYYDKTQLILDLQRNMEGIQSMSSLMENIIITFPNQKFSISTADGYRKDSSKEWDKVKSGSEYNYLIEYDNKIIMNFSYPLMYSVSEDYIPDFNIQIVLSPNTLSSYLSPFRGEGESGAAICFKLDSNYILDMDKKAIARKFINPGDSSYNIERDYQFISSESKKYPLSIVAYIDRKIIRQTKIKYIILLTAVMLVLSVLYSVSVIYTKYIVIKPLNELMSAFGQIQNNNFDVRIFHEPHDEFNYLYSGFNSAVSYIQELIANIYEQKSLIENAELAQLQSQINPHFLYNSFFIINRMAKNEAYDQIAKFVTSLARYYRFINKETKSYIPLSEELEHMNNYIDIQQMRFSDKISVEQDSVPELIRKVSVPKLILQPLIENAYNYGLADKLEKGIIRISYSYNGSFVDISVEDNGDEADNELVEFMIRQLNDDRNNDNHALNNIHRRLVLAYGNDCGITIGLGSLGGIRITLRIDSSVSLE